jgi:hypothetical protein
MAEADRQLPEVGEIFLDHVAHFVADPAAAASALARAGFQPTPPSIQVNRDATGVEVTAGTGNVTAMLARGYIEILFQTADTALGREFAGALARHPGLHLAAFAVDDAAKAHRRLAREGFHVRPLAALRRPVGTETGTAEAAFSVARVEPGDMAEGRIQLLTHHTEEAVWQKRWLPQPNGVRALRDVVISVADVEEATARFVRFLERPAAPSPGGASIALDRGRVVLMDAAGFASALPGLAIPSLPFMGAYALQVAALDATQSWMRQAGISCTRHGACLIVPFPSALGLGAWMFTEHPNALPWRR